MNSSSILDKEYVDRRYIGEDESLRSNLQVISIKATIRIKIKADAFQNFDSLIALNLEKM